MKTRKAEKELVQRKGTPVPFLPPGMGTRIGHAADVLGTRKLAAQAAGVSVDSLQRYIREENAPTFEAIARLARAAGVSLDWLAFGTGPDRATESPMPPYVVTQTEPTPELLQDIETVVELVENVLRDKEVELSPHQKARLIALAVGFVLDETPEAPARISRLVDLAAG